MLILGFIFIKYNYCKFIEVHEVDFNMNYLNIYLFNILKLFFNIIDNWVYNDNNCVWAWIWGEGNSGKWIKMNNPEAKGNTITFDIPAGTIGMNLVRAKASIDPSTLTDYASIGEYYNEIKDIAITDATTYNVEFK